jgi:hypothetical protein
MTYAAVITANADAAVTGRVKLALEKKAAVQIVNLVSSGDQRERRVCNSILDENGVPRQYVDMVLIMLDLTGGVTVTSPTDAQIDTAVDTLWARMIALVA